LDRLPRLYAIADADVLRRRGVGLREFAMELRAAGVRLVQWRDKGGSPQKVLAGAEVLREVFEAGEGLSACQAVKQPDMGLRESVRLVMNDRADMAVLAGFWGVHVGQGDLAPEDARLVVGADRWVGVSTHTDEQVRGADLSCADYVAVGPVFATGTKVDAEPVIGLEGVRRARALTGKPIVAIGGITRENARSVVDAGADSVAVISGLLCEGESVQKVAEDFLRILG
jgi:thiamine-phosphate pyrophosphorylase